MSSQENGHPALAADEPGKLTTISNRQLSEWYKGRQVSTESKILASGLSHCKLLASVFPASVDVQKIKTGYFTVVSSHNWKLFTTGMDRIGIEKIFNVAKLQLPNSVEMKQLNIWMKEFVEMNEKKFVGVPMEERPGAYMSVVAKKYGSQVSIGSRKSAAKHNVAQNTSSVARNDSKKAAKRSTAVPKQNVSLPVNRIVAKTVQKKSDKKAVGCSTSEDLGKLIEKTMTMENGEVKVAVENASSEKKNTEIGEKLDDDLAKRGENEQNDEHANKGCEIVDKKTSESEETVEAAKDIPFIGIMSDSTGTCSSSLNSSLETSINNGARLFAFLNGKDVTKCNHTPIPAKGVLVRSSLGSFISPVDEIEMDKEIESVEKKANNESIPRDLSLSLSSSSSSGTDALDLSVPIPSPEMKGGDVFNVQDEDSHLNTTFITPSRRRRADLDSVRRVLQFDD